MKAASTRSPRAVLPDAVHYFPPGMYGGAFIGGRTIGERWSAAVAQLGSQWALERVVIDVDANSAVAEWTHYKTQEGTVLRGDEWYEFDPSTGLISEIRAYYASPQARDLERLELEGFDYAGRGYSVEPRTREVDTELGLTSRRRLSEPKQGERRPPKDVLDGACGEVQVVPDQIDAPVPEARAALGPRNPYPRSCVPCRSVSQSRRTSGLRSGHG